MIVNGYGRLRAVTATLLPMRERGVCSTPRRRLRGERVEALTDLFKALSDPTRIEIVAILRDADEPVCICDLETTFELSQPTLSHHMARLREAGLLDTGKQGIWCYYSLRRDLPAQVKRVIEAIV